MGRSYVILCATDTLFGEIMIKDDATPDFPGLLDLASADYGGQVLYSTDDFFAAAENMLSPRPPVFMEEEYTERSSPWACRGM